MTFPSFSPLIVPPDNFVFLYGWRLFTFAAGQIMNTNIQPHPASVQLEAPLAFQVCLLAPVFSLLITWEWDKCEKLVESARVRFFEAVFRNV